MKITTKFVGSSLIVLGLVTALLIGGDVSIRKAEQSAQIEREKINRALENILTLNLSLSDQVKALKDIILLRKDSANVNKYQQALVQFDQSLRELESLSPQTAADLPRVRRRHQFLQDLAQGLLERSPTETPLRLSQSQQDFRVINSFEKDINFYLDFIENNLQQKEAIDQQNFSQFKQNIQVTKTIIILLTLLLFITQLVLIFLPVIRSIQQLQIGAAKIGTGDLDYRLNIQTHDEIEQLGHAFNQMATKLSESYRILELKKKAADAANQAKSEFLANMSHELRTPLNGILGYTQILERDRTLTPKQQNGLNIIYQCGSHLLTLINDILDLSKIEAQKLELYESNFHFPSFLHGVEEICRIRAEQKGISFVYQPTSDLPIAVYADEKRLRQVLINLLGNAIKFTENGGVTFTVGAIEPTVSSSKIVDETKAIANSTLSNQQSISTVDSANSPQKIHSLRFQITDTGIGMTQEQIDKIFLPFEQFGNTKKQAEGTGLGLAISQKIVQMMQSTIQVKSQLNQGSVFWMDLKLPEVADWVQAARVFEHKKIIGFSGVKRKILVVDDKWENRSVIVNLLEVIGFEICEATQGQEGLEKVANFHPDLIITDLVMPVMDGFEMLRHLRHSLEFKDILVIVSSASVFETDQFKSLEAGANDFLAKPVNAEELLQKLEKLLQLEWIYEEPQNLSVATLGNQKNLKVSDRGDIIGVIGEPRKVLVVDTQWESRSSIATFLSEIGLEIAEAVNGKEGLEKAITFQPDLIIFELKMPEMNELEIIKNIRESPLLEKTIILVLSAQLLESERQQVLEAGVNDFLVKPVERNVLLECLRKHLNLEWVYENSLIQSSAIADSKTLNTTLIAPAGAEIQALFELAMKGNLKGVINKMTLLEQSDPNLKVFAEKVRELARNFQEQELLEFIRQYY